MFFNVLASLYCFFVLVPYLYIFSCRVQFLETGPELGNTYTEVISQQDVAIYGGLCALACFERPELEVNFCCSYRSNTTNIVDVVSSCSIIPITYHII